MKVLKLDEKWKQEAEACRKVYKKEAEHHPEKRKEPEMDPNAAEITAY